MAQAKKRLGLFDFIRNITEVQKQDFWDNITEEDRKGWSTFLVNRFLSMNTDFLPLVNEVQKYDLKPKLLYKMYADMIPKGKYYLRYVKGKKEKQMAYEDWLVNIVCNDLEVSKREAKETIDILMMTEGGVLELTEIANKYGVDSKKMKKAGLIVE